MLDKNRKLLNKVLPRGSKLNDTEFNQGVEVWILSSDNKILITQRSSLKSHPLMWEAPGGCSLSGETTIQTAIREIKEEIGLDINCDNLKLLSTQLYKYQFVDIYSIKQDIILSSLKLQSSEIAGAKLVTLKELENMIDNNQVIPYITKHYSIIKDFLR